MNYDKNNNETKAPGEDRIFDFVTERLVYLPDQENIPYGNYSAVNKDAY